MPETVPFMLITSLYLPHLQQMLSSHATAQHFILGHPVPYLMLSYYDGPGNCPQIANVTWIELLRAQPWAATLAAHASSKDSLIQQGYGKGRSHGGLQCIVGQIFKRTGFCKDVYTVYKVAAIYDAVVRHMADYLVWVDADTQIVGAFDGAFWSWHRAFHIVTKFRDDVPPHVKGYPETGVMGISAAAEPVHAVLHAARAAYFLPALYNAMGGVNDIQIWGYLLAPSLKSNMTSRLGSHVPPAVSEARLLVGDYRDFDIKRYILHHKSRGPMILSQTYHPSNSTPALTRSE